MRLISGCARKKRVEILVRFGSGSGRARTFRIDDADDDDGGEIEAIQPTCYKENDKYLSTASVLNKSHNFKKRTRLPFTTMSLWYFAES